MKILQVYPYFYPAWCYGGVTRVCYEISRTMAKHHEVTVYTTDALNRYKRIDISENPKIIDGIETFYFNNLSNFLCYKYHIPTPVDSINLIKANINKYDIIHLHGYSHLLNIISSYYANKYKTPYVIQTHGALAASIKNSFFHNIFDYLFGYKILKSARKMIALNETEKEMYIKMGGSKNKIEIIPNGINLDGYENLPKKGSFKKKYGIKDDEKIVLYLGRLHKTKGIELLIKAFANLKKKYNKIKLFLIGPDDGFKYKLHELVKTLNLENEIIFLGFISQKEKLAALVDAKVFCTPKFTGFPITFIEACACGTPIITSDGGDVLDWIDNKVGYVVDYDEKQFEEAIYKIIDNKELRKKFSKNCKLLVKEKFNWNKIMNKVESLYIRVVQK